MTMTKSFDNGDDIIMTMSDRRVKTNIQLIGKSPLGIPIYKYKYTDLASGDLGGEDEIVDLDTTRTFVGVMAQDLLDLSIPDAVWKNPKDGYYRVNYSKVDVDFYRLND